MSETQALPASELMETAIGLASKLSKARVDQLRKKHPDASPAELTKMLDREFVSLMTGQGVATGLAAAVPGAGTAVALVVAGGEAVATMNWTAFYVLALADVQGVSITEVERKRELLIAVLFGGSVRGATKKVVARTGKHWSKKIIQKVPAGAIKGINKVMGVNFITRYGTKQGVIVLGKVVPFGVGAAIGGAMNFATATALVKSAHKVFGLEGTTDEVIDLEDLGEVEDAIPERVV